MRFPEQAPPIFRAFMREVVGRQWAQSPTAQAKLDIAPKKKGKAGVKSVATRQCLMRLTTFAPPSRRR